MKPFRVALTSLLFALGLIAAAQQSSISRVFDSFVNHSRAVGLSHAKVSDIALQLYIADFDDRLPQAAPNAKVLEILDPHVKDKSYFLSVNPMGGRFLFNAHMAGMTMPKLPYPAETIVFYDERPWPDGRRLVAFLDGHVAFVSPERWRELLAKEPRAVLP